MLTDNRFSKGSDLIGKNIDGIRQMPPAPGTQLKDIPPRAADRIDGIGRSVLPQVGAEPIAGMQGDRVLAKGQIPGQLRIRVEGDGQRVFYRRTISSAGI